MTMVLLCDRKLRLPYKFFLCIYLFIFFFLGGGATDYRRLQVMIRIQELNIRRKRIRESVRESGQSEWGKGT